MTSDGPIENAEAQEMPETEAQLGTEGVSEAKVRANRKNAKMSTGPRTPEGKSVSRYNALKHGLFSDEVLVRSERLEELEALGKAFREQLRPTNVLEQTLVDRIVACVWRLRRALRAETAFVQRYIRSADEPDYRGNPRDPVTVALERAQAGVNANTEKVLKYETSIERQLYRALRELQELRRHRDPQPTETESESSDY